jgi:hypothetical protein
MGLRYGVQSGAHSLCAYTDRWAGLHQVTFVDNDYLAYDHARHLRDVQAYRPRYATVRDIMDPAQCAAAGVAYFPLEQILDWAAELSAYAERVIVIPKYDCLDRLPASYVLGYSIPSSHGGTFLPPEAFRGRPVHLLGGSWKSQLNYLSFLGEDVVSFDSNYIEKIAAWAQWMDPDGNAHTLADSPLPFLHDSRTPYYLCLVLSFASMASKVRSLVDET